jgi:hypothetical protein
MILTEIFVVMCTLASQCVHYADLTPGALSVDGCERAIYELARDHTIPGTVLQTPRRPNTSEKRDAYVPKPAWLWWHSGAPRVGTCDLIFVGGGISTVAELIFSRIS